MFFILRLSFILKLSVIFYTFHAVPVFKKGKCLASFQGSAKEQVESEIKRLGVENFIKEYKGQEGCVQLSESSTVRMDHIYRLVLGALKEEQMSRLKWQEFQGTAEEFSKLERKLLQEGELKKISGMEGYVLFANQYFEGNMQKTYKNVSAVLGRSNMGQLKWQQFHGTTGEFSNLAGKLFEGGKSREEYTDMDGYVLFADQTFGGDMQKTYKNVSAVLGRSNMGQLKWQEFNGTTGEFSKLKGNLLNEKGKPREEYTGMEGYVLFADQYFEGNMQKTYQNVSAVLDRSSMGRLKWQLFQGTTGEFSNLEGNLLNEKGKPREEYTGMEGYVLFADQYFEGKMQKTYQNVSAVLDRSSMGQLKWQAFNGTTGEFSNLEGKLFEGGKLREKYTGMDGYARFADQYFEGMMQKTFTNVSAVLGGAEAMKELGLGWKSFQGAADQYRELKKLFAAKRSIGDLGDRKGQEYAADTIFKGNTKRTYRNVSVLREELLGSRKAFKELNWQDN